MIGHRGEPIELTKFTYAYQASIIGPMDRDDPAYGALVGRNPACPGDSFLVALRDGREMSLGMHCRPGGPIIPMFGEWDNRRQAHIIPGETLEEICEAWERGRRERRPFADAITSYLGVPLQEGIPSPGDYWTIRVVYEPTTS